MARSAALSLYMIAAARPRSENLEKRRRPDRPDESVFWCHVADPDDAGVAVELAYQLQIRDFPDLTLLITAKEPIEASSGSLEGFAEVVPEENTAFVDRFLEHWRPDVAAFIGLDLRAALIVRADERGIPLVLLNARAPTRTVPGITSAVLSRFRQIMALGPKDALELRRLAGRQVAIQVSERLVEGASPLPCDEAVLAEMSEAIGGRPVWHAANLDESEFVAFERAYARASALSHRLLAIVTLKDEQTSDRFVDWIHARGLRYATRSEDERPDTNTQVFVADLNEEAGIWYRLAAVSFLGQSLTPGGSGTNPMAAAALGSAILFGPHVGKHRRRFDRLSRAGATRMVINGDSLGVAVGSLMNPDRAAAMAHAAWAATSDGASVADRLVDMIGAYLAEADE